MKPTLALPLVVLVLVLAVAARAGAADTWTTPHPGIRRLLRTTSTPNRVHALFVDLCAAGVSLRATSSGENRRTPSSFGSLVGAEAVINGDFFSYDTYAPVGLAIGDDVQWHGDSASEGYVAFGRERAYLSPPAERTVPEWITEAVGGRPQLVRAGAISGPFPDPSHCGARNPRTAVGLTSDGRTLILVVVDGRSTSSAGMTCNELASLMVDLGAHDALNLDGGGSSAMWVRGVGVVNRPSDGSERVVANHLAVHATGSGDPGSCDYSLDEVLGLAEMYDDARTTDVDGDGIADLCVRSSAGVRCHLGARGGADAIVDGPALSDMSGWSEPQYWSTLRMGDLNGDGRADLCARAGGGVRCWLSMGSSFGGEIVGPELSDAVGWGALTHATSLRLADFDGDGMDDLCVRASAGFRCYPSTGDGFAAPVLGPELSNATGWNDPDNYGTIRMGDVNGDGRADVCARGNDGMRCWLSDAGGFATAIDGPSWDDASGWDHVSQWSTIRLVDVDGDGRSDLCGRSSAGFACHLSTGDGFAAASGGPEISNATGWGDYDNYATLRMADLDGDGSADVCGRANAGIRCWLWDGTAHAIAVTGPELSDAMEWDEPQYFRTLRLADVDGDRRADLCARGPSGVRCFLSDGAGFPTEAIGPELSDAVGWANERYYATMRLAGPRCVARVETCGDGRDDDCDGVIDDGCGGDGGAPASDGGTTSADAATMRVDGAVGRDAAPAIEPPPASGGCACRVVSSNERSGVVWLAIAALACALGMRRRTR